MKKTLHFPGDPGAVMEMWGRLSTALQNPKRPMTLRIANRLFGEKTFKFEQPFLDKTRDAYGAPLEPTDFQTAPDASRDTINKWVEVQTEKRIKDLLPPKSITADTRMVLVNAIYFLADWMSQFEKEATWDRPFHVTATDERRVPTMNQAGRFRLAKADGVKVLELPYKGGDAAMLVILPDAVDGLAAVEQSLDAAKLGAWREALAPVDEVIVALPKFTIDPAEPIELVPALKALGMSLAFDPQTADFTGIGIPPDPSRRLFIGAVFHKAFVKVDEKGTEAAAATAVVMPEGAGAAPGPPPVQFIADHPFLFAIVDQSSGLILFLGRVVEPKA
jgi:serpin B